MADNELLIKITAETKAAQKALDDLNKELDKLTKQEKKNNTSSKKTTTQNAKTTKSYKAMGVGIKSVAASLAALGVASKAIEFEKLAEEASQSAEAFKLVFEDMGLVAEAEFDKIREASKGLVSEADIRQSAVTAASLGVPIEKLAELMEIARVKSREMGTDAQTAFRDLAVGIGRGSPMILDNLGLTIKLEEANKKYAEKLGTTVDKMTKQEKQMALTNAVIEAGADSIERFADAGLSSAQKTQVLNSKLSDLKVQIGNSLIPLMDKLKTSSIGWLEKLDEAAINKVTDNLATVGKALKAVNDYLIPDIGGEEIGILDTIANGYGKIFEHMTLFSKFGDTLDLSSGIAESQKDIDEFIISLSELGGEQDRYKGKLENVQTAYKDQAAELNSLMESNQELQKYFNELNPTAFVNELNKLRKEEELLAEQSTTLGETFKTIFPSETATATNENAEALRVLKEQLIGIKGIGDEIDPNAYIIEPKVKVDGQKAIIEISDSLGNVENKVEIKPPVKIDEKQVAVELDQSVRKAINKLGDDAKLIKVVMEIDNAGDFADATDNLTKPITTTVTLEDNADEVQDKIDVLKEDTYSTHTVNIVYNDGGAPTQAISDAVNSNGGL